MKSLIAITVFLSAVTHAFQPGREAIDPLSDSFIRKVNENARTWRAKRSFPEGTTFDKLRKLAGVLPDFQEAQNAPIKPRSSPLLRAQDLPKNFDARKHWLNCPVIEEVRDQGECGSCWAVSAVSVMSDRTCIASNGTKNFHYSTQDLLTCCYGCGDECDGGYPYSSFKYWVRDGIVSGGPYDSKEGCAPYRVPPSGGESQEFDSVHEKNHYYYCSKTCKDPYEVPYEEDLHFGKSSYALPKNETEIMNELVTNGPVVATMSVYADFFSYESGVYAHESHSLAGYHAIRMVGYGEENGVPYWLCANSWGANWGEKGFFKILRGKNECGIDQGIYAGLPM